MTIIINFFIIINKNAGWREQIFWRHFITFFRWFCSGLLATGDRHSDKVDEVGSLEEEEYRRMMARFVRLRC